MDKRAVKKTAQTHGRDFYEENGQKGGEKTAQTHDKEFYSQIGRKGGKNSHKNG
ncbi:general stress protein (plasmid) [Melissococcus plutonius DAT561]|nr:general stress protein [Melissococcus plutonius DAT561]